MKESKASRKYRKPSKDHGNRPIGSRILRRGKTKPEKSLEDKPPDKLIADLKKMQEILWKARGHVKCPTCDGEGAVPKKDKS